MTVGVEGFVQGLARLGCAPRVDAGLVLYSIEAVDGQRAGHHVETAVSVEELAKWPLVPPHWIHLASDVHLTRTNSRPSSRAGWTMHSRQIKDWGDGTNPASSWASHVRGVLSEVNS
ncbi:MAG TPA: hypothetical protein VHO25_18365 [Polyangiaceae bacterium]|nr:hypothetical protein [Polyangiaceae bacterium]